MYSSTSFQHSSLVLGNLANAGVLGIVDKIGKLQARIDAAYDRMNSCITMRRGLAMTINELMDMSVDVTALRDKIAEMDVSIRKSATDYMTIRLQSESDILKLKQSIVTIDTSETLQSPLDYEATKVKNLPLASDSMKLDSQYFSFEKNEQSDPVANIETYLRESTSSLGSKSADVARQAAAQISQQRDNHSVAGTLILTVTCTHRNIAVLDPMVIDPDKCVSVWNSMYGKSEPIITTDPMQVKLMYDSGEQSTKSITLVSGASYGSSFIGMVHMLRNEDTAVGSIDNIAKQLQEKLKLGGWLQNASGGFGIDKSVMDEVKKMLSTQGITSHVSLLVNGAVPTMESTKLQQGIKELAKPDAESLKQFIDAQSNNEDTTVETGAEDARAGNQMLQVKNARLQTIMRELTKTDREGDSVLGMNTLMSAFTNYLTAITTPEGKVGIPVSFYLTKISRSEIAKLWLEKYYPNERAGNVKSATSKPADAQPAEDNAQDG